MAASSKPFVPKRVLMAFATVFAVAGAGSAQKPERKTAQSALQRAGIKTPGIQIPFANLKPETQLESSANAEWVFFANSVFVPGKDGIDRFDSKTNQKLDPIPGLPKVCGGMASAFDSLWAPVCGNSSLARIDSKTFKVTNTIASGVATAPEIITATPDSIWLLTDGRTTVSRIDPEQNMVVAEIRVPAGCRSVVFGESALWLACPAENKVLRINPATNLVDKAIEVSAQPEALAVGAGSVWALCRKEGKLDRIDPKTNKVSKTIDLAVPNAEGSLAFGEGFLWVTQPGFPLARVDAVSESVLQQFYGEGGGAIAISPGAIWLGNLKAAGVWRIDPKRVLATIPE